MIDSTCEKKSLKKLAIETGVLDEELKINYDSEPEPVLELSAEVIEYCKHDAIAMETAFNIFT